MNIRRLIWCFYCERCFAVYVSDGPANYENIHPDEWKPPYQFKVELEMQLGVEAHGEIVAQCAYSDCVGGPNGFWWWERFRIDQPDLPIDPPWGQQFPLYEKLG